ncbi:MAG: shikimate kinase [Lewinellaceae bacterium]|nr:shikimate kinase [Lewinellaceae bacterium]
MLKKTCFLLGFMGSGKTYWGHRLSERLKVAFVDLDDVIENGEQCSIETIFLQAGADGFRQLERQYLRELALYPPRIIATGGGTPCFFDNMDWMNAHGTTIYLDVPVPVLATRLRANRATRPLLKDVPERGLEVYIGCLLEQREPVYRSARIVVQLEDDADSFLEKLEESATGISRA